MSMPEMNVLGIQDCDNDFYRSVNACHRNVFRSFKYSGDCRQLAYQNQSTVALESYRIQSQS